MIWTFRRGDAIVRLESSYDTTSHEFVLAMMCSDGPPTVERFRTIRKFRTRVLAIEGQLSDEHWTQIASPEILTNDSPRPVIH